MGRSVRRGAIAILGALAFVVPVAACSSSESGKPVSITLKDYSITANPTSVAAGKVTFTVTNEGEFVHEMLVVKADSPSSLPLKADGSIDEDALGEANIAGEASDINPSKTAKLTLTLAAGKYLLICNRADGMIHHYKEGMVTPLTVT